MRKILHVLSQRPEKTGSGIYLQSLLKISNQKDYQQAVIAGVPSEVEKVDLANINRDNFYPVKFECQSLDFPVVGMSDLMPYKSTCYKDLDQEMFNKCKREFERVVKKAVREFKPDLIISHHLWLLTSLLKKLFPEIKVIAISHGTGLRQLRKNQRFRDYVISGCRNLDQIFALTEHQKEEIAALYGIDQNKIILTGAGYDSNIFYQPDKEVIEEKIKLIYAGKLSASKGVKHLIKACDLLEENLKEKIELSLYGSGSGQELAQIKKAAQKTDLNVHFPGAVPQAELAEAFRKSDIFCLPSFYEGLPLVIIEGLASGLRIVTTDLAGLKDYLGSEINNSGFIEYVELPRLQDTDIPFREDIEDFGKSFSTSIKKQIHNLKTENNLKQHQHQKLSQKDLTDFRSKIESLSWQGIFEKMDKYF